MQIDRKQRGRLAPSPTGALHLGNARSFLLAWLSIRSQQGTIVLRIEDLDHPKVKPEYMNQIFEDLTWLGLDWDEGPDIGGPYEPYIQSQRIPYYKTALNELLEQNLVYPCICSRKDVDEAQSAPHAPSEGVFYPGTCAGRFRSFEEARSFLPPSRLPTWRFRTSSVNHLFTDGLHGPQQQNVSESCGDFILARHEDGAGYMLAVVVDDHMMNISEVVRGDDLLTTTHRQGELFNALGLEPPEYIHAPLVVAADGRRLAKRYGDTKISTLRNQGVSPKKIVGLLAFWSGLSNWKEEISSHELIQRYSLNSIPHQPVILTQKVKDYLEID